MNVSLNSALRRELFRKMLRIRRFQQRVDSEYLKDEMRTPVHLCIGQEALAVGACQALRADDFISSNHRGHGHYLAKGGDMKALTAELHGRTTGCSKGYGGSMHIIDASVGHLGSSSIVGGGIPIGTGHALAFQIRGENRISLIFLGDGAAEEGVLYESIHFAVLKRLPVIYLLENNGWAVCSPRAARQNAPSIFHRAYNPELLAAAGVDGNQVEEVYRAVSAAVERARQGLGPSFIEGLTYRITGHAGCQSQDPQGYRDPAEIEAWRRKCPVDTYRQVLLERKILSDSDLAAMEETIAGEISEAFDYARSSPIPGPSEAAGRVYCE